MKLKKFLEKNLNEEDLVRLEQHLSIDQFKLNQSVNNEHFLQLGIASKIKSTNSSEKVR